MIKGAISEERELLEAYVRKRDEAAFAKLARKHQGMMQATALRVSGDSEEALDAMQRALIAFARRAGEVHADHGVGPWLHRATTLEAMALRRQRLKRRDRERTAMEAQQLENAGVPSEAAAELDGAIDRLSPKDRAAIVLHFFEGQTFRGIADQLGGTEAAWQKRGSRALEKLSGMLQRRGVVATGTALGAWLVASRADGAVLNGTFTLMSKKALNHPTVTGAPLQSSPVFLLIMKTKIILAACFLGGAILSYSWSDSTKSGITEVQKSVARTADTIRFSSKNDRPRGFNIESIAVAVLYFDELEEANPSAENQLRALMFSVPEDYLKEVYELLAQVGNPDRFGEVAAAFFARWAELDPETAWRIASTEETYPAAARRGAMLTWLSTDTDAALESLLDQRVDDDIAILREYVDGVVQHAPRSAAEFVDRMAEAWPKADVDLFPRVARRWAMENPELAGDWIASHWNADVRNEILRTLSYEVARSKGPKGMALATLIDDPGKRRYAREQAARWWGISSGGPSLVPDWGDPEYNIPHGFPEDWTRGELRSFSLGLMANFSKNYPQLVKRARTDEQRQAVYEGVIEGISFSLPKVGKDAVERVSPSYAETPSGRKSLKTYILRWSEIDSAEAQAWLASQPNDAKKGVMSEVLKPKSTP